MSPEAQYGLYSPEAVAYSASTMREAQEEGIFSGERNEWAYAVHPLRREAAPVIPGEYRGEKEFIGIECEGGPRGRGCSIAGEEWPVIHTDAPPLEIMKLHEWFEEPGMFGAVFRTKDKDYFAYAESWHAKSPTKDPWKAHEQMAKALRGGQADQGGRIWTHVFDTFHDADFEFRSEDAQDDIMHYGYSIFIFEHERGDANPAAAAGNPRTIEEDKVKVVELRQWAAEKLPHVKVKSKTVGFQDLARTDALIVRIEGETHKEDVFEAAAKAKELGLIFSYGIVTLPSRTDPMVAEDEAARTWGAMGPEERAKAAREIPLEPKERKALPGMEWAALSHQVRTALRHWKAGVGRENPAPHHETIIDRLNRAWAFRQEGRRILARHEYEEAERRYRRLSLHERESFRRIDGGFAGRFFDQVARAVGRGNPAPGGPWHIRGTAARWEPREDATLLVRVLNDAGRARRGEFTVRTGAPARVVEDMETLSKYGIDATASPWRFSDEIYLTGWTREKEEELLHLFGLKRADIDHGIAIENQNPRRRTRYRPLGWERQPVDWSWSVAFKRPRSGRLLWIDSETKNVDDASRVARQLVEERHPGKGYREYGVSKSYWRKWAQYDESITKGEYEAVRQKGKAGENPETAAVALDPRLRQYLETALWSSTDEGGNPLDVIGFGIDDFAPEAVERARRDVERFFRMSNKERLLEGVDDGEQVAHDFWLTRNHHGAGFWDRPQIYGKAEAERLTEIAHGFGETDVVVGDDGRLHLEGGAANPRSEAAEGRLAVFAHPSAEASQYEVWAVSRDEEADRWTEEAAIPAYQGWRDAATKMWRDWPSLGHAALAMMGLPYRRLRFVFLSEEGAETFGHWLEENRDRPRGFEVGLLPEPRRPMSGRAENPPRLLAVWFSGVPGIRGNIFLEPHKVAGAVDTAGYILRMGPRGGWRWENPKDPGRYVPVGRDDRYDWVDWRRHRDRQPPEVVAAVEAEAERLARKYPEMAARANPRRVELRGSPGRGLLYRGEYELPTQSQATGRDLAGEEILLNRGKEASGYMLTDEQLAEIQAGVGPLRYMLPYSYVVRAPGRPEFAWTAFFTRDEMEKWLKAYDLRLDREPEHGGHFAVRLPMDDAGWQELHRRPETERRRLELLRVNPPPFEIIGPGERRERPEEERRWYWAHDPSQEDTPDGVVEQLVEHTDGFGPPLAEIHQTQVGDGVYRYDVSLPDGTKVFTVTGSIPQLVEARHAGEHAAGVPAERVGTAFENPAVLAWEETRPGRWHGATPDFDVWVERQRGPHEAYDWEVRDHAGEVWDYGAALTPARAVKNAELALARASAELEAARAAGDWTAVPAMNPLWERTTEDFWEADYASGHSASIEKVDVGEYHWIVWDQENRRTWSGDEEWLPEAKSAAGEAVRSDETARRRPRRARQLRIRPGEARTIGEVYGAALGAATRWPGANPRKLRETVAELERMLERGEIDYRTYMETLAGEQMAEEVQAFGRWWDSSAAAQRAQMLRDLGYPEDSAERLSRSTWADIPWGVYFDLAPEAALANPPEFPLKDEEILGMVVDALVMDKTARRMAPELPRLRREAERGAKRYPPDVQRGAYALLFREHMMYGGQRDLTMRRALDEVLSEEVERRELPEMENSATAVVGLAESNPGPSPGGSYDMRIDLPRIPPDARHEVEDVLRRYGYDVDGGETDLVECRSYIYLDAPGCWSAPDEDVVAMEFAAGGPGENPNRLNPAAAAEEVRYCLRGNCGAILETFGLPAVWRCPACGTFRRVAAWEGPDAPPRPRRARRAGAEENPEGLRRIEKAMGVVPRIARRHATAPWSELPVSIRRDFAVANPRPRERERGIEHCASFGEFIERFHTIARAALAHGRHSEVPAETRQRWRADGMRWALSGQASDRLDVGFPDLIAYLAADEVDDAMRSRARRDFDQMGWWEYGREGFVNPPHEEGVDVMVAQAWNDAEVWQTMSLLSALGYFGRERRLLAETPWEELPSGARAALKPLVVEEFGVLAANVYRPTYETREDIVRAASERGSISRDDLRLLGFEPPRWALYAVQIVFRDAVDYDFYPDAAEAHEAFRRLKESTDAPVHLLTVRDAAANPLPWGVSEVGWGPASRRHHSNYEIVAAHIDEALDYGRRGDPSMETWLRGAIHGIVGDVWQEREMFEHHYPKLGEYVDAFERNITPEMRAAAHEALDRLKHDLERMW